MRRLLFMFLITSNLAMAQKEVTLEQCYYDARENYPNLKQSGLLEKIYQLNLENIKNNLLPVINLNGQATWQSDVTKVDIPIPNIKMPQLPKDQYKIYLEARQNIWDGGITKMQEKIEESVLKTGLSQLEIEFYQLKDQVNEVFFTALNLKKQFAILEKQVETLNERMNQVTSAVRNGISEESNKWILEAEILTVNQQKTKIETGCNASLAILSILTGKDVLKSDVLVFKGAIVDEGTANNRPEFALFNNRRDQLAARSGLLEKQRYPRIFGFGQLGYGRPGLNMLNNKFDSFYLLGIGMTWNVWDFRKVQRDVQGIRFQQETITAQEETFKRNLSILLTRQRSVIEEISSLIEKDKQIVELRGSIASVSASKLKNGILTASDFTRDLNAETIALLNLETHRLQLEEAKIKYNTFQGN